MFVSLRVHSITRIVRIHIDSDVLQYSEVHPVQETALPGSCQTGRKMAQQALFVNVSSWLFGSFRHEVRGGMWHHDFRTRIQTSSCDTSVEG